MCIRDSVLGICNGFQILCEAGLLPGALIRNRDLRFHCEQVFLKTANFETPFTSEVRRDGVPIRIPIAHGEGCYFADAPTLDRLQAQRQILWQYCDASGAVTEAANPIGIGSLSHGTARVTVLPQDLALCLQSIERGGIGEVASLSLIHI